ncbi:MAG: hypothetical protein ACRDRH_28175 [Pseudonocardia sp.]
MSVVDAALAVGKELSMQVQFLTEMLVVEVVSPTMTRVPDPSLFDVPLLRLADELRLASRRTVDPVLATAMGH